MNTEVEYTENEVLTGAELYLYLLRQNEMQQQRAHCKLREYAALKETLQVLTERSRRRVLAPVAGGLAYFPAELNATNTILVLLGDSWFAERSAVQAAEIAGRRINFLRREAEVLRQEEETLRSKQTLFLSEVPEAQDAVAQLLAERDVRHASLVLETTQPSLAPLAVPTTSSSAPSLAGYPAQNQQHRAPAAAALPSAVQAPKGSGERVLPNESSSTSSLTAPAPSSVPTAADTELDYLTVDAALATFDEQDELTEDELIALEKELGDRLDDDAYVEQVMTERMIEKKERRVRAELERRQAALAGSKAAADAAEARAALRTDMAASSEAPPSVSSSAQPANGSYPSVEPGGARPVAALAVTRAYSTPGDIGACGSVGTAAKTEAATLTEVKHADPTTTPPPIRSPSPSEVSQRLPTPVTNVLDGPHAPAASSTVAALPSSFCKERHVRFADDAASDLEQAAASTAAATREQGGGAPASASVPCVLRRANQIGDIVERSTMQQDVSTLPPPPLQTQHQKPKRKSLFMRELEGDGA